MSSMSFIVHVGGKKGGGGGGEASVGYMSYRVDIVHTYKLVICQIKPRK